MFSRLIAFIFCKTSFPFKSKLLANTWSDVTDEDKKKLKIYFERFSNHVEPKCNPLFSRYKFHKRVQTESETVETFVTDLTLLVRECSFKEPYEIIRDRIVFATSSRKIREKLIDESKDLTPGQGLRLLSNI